jgi:4-amino-4-deoxy-L-arabinose transferase-like glycosyltransferase
MDHSICELCFRNSLYAWGLDVLTWMILPSQFICITIAPAFLTASIYLCLARIIIAHGEQYSRLRPRTYSLLFVGFDLLSLVLQAAGGALAALADTAPDADRGVNIMIAGLALQVFSLLVFMALWGDFAWRAHKAVVADVGTLREDASDLAGVRASFRFKTFKASK